MVFGLTLDSVSVFIGFFMGAILIGLWVSRIKEQEITRRENTTVDIQQRLLTSQETLHTIQTEKARLEERDRGLEKQATQLAEEMAQLKQQLTTSQENLNKLHGERESLSAKLEKECEWKKNIDQQWKQQLESFMLANIKVVKEDATKEYATKQKAIEVEVKGMIEPLSKSLAEYKKQVEEIDKDHYSSKNQITDELKRVSETNAKVTSVLTYNKGRGNWGELMLERLLEDSGMIEGIGYTKQETYDGKRPDFRVILPENRSIFIDSKALGISLDAPLDDGTEEAFKARAQRHLNALKAAAKSLSSKEYQANYSKAADFVVLYVPNEGMLSLSYEADPEIFQWAYNQKVILASPLNLMAMLQLVNRTWKMYKLSQDANDVLKMAEEIFSQAVVASRALNGVESTLGTLNTKYKDLKRTFTGEHSGLKKRIGKLAEYGADKGNTLPEDLDKSDGFPSYKSTAELTELKQTEDKEPVITG